MAAIDPILANLVSVFEHLSIHAKPLPHVDLAVTVGSMLVVGQLCTELQFMDAGAGRLKLISEMSEDSMLSAVVSADYTFVKSRHSIPILHLKNVEFRVPGGKGEPLNEGEYWRAPLDRIDGFCINSGNL